MTVEIANVVGSGDLHTELDLEPLEADLATPSLEYEPSNYHGLYIRLEEDGPLITVYRSRKYIISGYSSIDRLEKTNDDFLEQLTALGIVTKGQDAGFSVQNVVCTAALTDKVQLNALSIALGLESTEYEPEQFPGLIYRPEEIPAVMLVFANGKVVITGGPDVDTAEDAFSHLEKQIESLLEG